MSIEIMNAVWRHSQSKGRARLVLLSIADHQGELGAWPSVETLARMVNSSPRSVQRDIQELIELGELQVDFRSAPTYGPYKANRYWVKLPGVTNQASEVTETASEVTDFDSEVTKSHSEVTAGGVLTLNRNTNKPNKKPKAKAEKIADDWKPSQSVIDDYETKYKGLNHQRELEKFINYYQSRDIARKSWDGSFRNWLLNALDYQGIDNKKPEPVKPIFGRIK